MQVTNPYFFEGKPLFLLFPLWELNLLFLHLFVLLLDFIDEGIADAGKLKVVGELLEQLLRAVGHDGINGLHLHHGNTLGDDAQFLGGTPGEVDDASADKRTAVGDLHNDFLAVGRVLHMKHRTEWVGAVRTGEAVVVKPFSVGCACACCTFRIIGGLATHSLG